MGSLWVGPSALMLLCLTIVPLCMLIIFGFMQGNLTTNGGFPPFTVDNYKNMFLSPTFSKLMTKSIGIGLLVTLICMAIAYPVAWTIAKIVSPQNRSLLIMLAIIPFFTSQLLLIYAMMVILQSGGILMTFLASIGFANSDSSLLYSNTAVIIILVYEYLPYMILCLYSSMEGINDNIIYASRSLGAGWVKTFINVVFPMSIPGLLSGILLVLVPVCGSFVEPTIVGGPNGMMVGSLINSQFSVVLNMGYGAALSFVFLLVLSALMGIIQISVNKANRAIGGVEA